MDIVTLVSTFAVGVFVPVGVQWIRSRSDVQQKTAEVAPAVEVERIKAASADVTARHHINVEREKQQGETDRAEITGTRDIVAAATAWGVAVAAQHRECEEARKRDAHECDERISVLEQRMGIARKTPSDPHLIVKP